MPGKPLNSAWTRLTAQKDLLQVLFFLALCLLGVAFGLNRHIHALMRFMGVLGVVFLFRARNAIVWRKAPVGLWCAVLFAVYVLLTPGAWFADVAVGWKIFAVLVAGVAAGMVRRVPLSGFMRGLAASLILSGLVWIVFSPASFVNEEGRLALCHSPNVVSSILAWCALYFLSGDRESTGCTQRVSLLVVGSCFFLMGLAASRTAQLGFLSVLLLVLLFRLSWKRIAFVLAGLALCGVLGHALLPDMQKQRLVSVVTSPLDDTTLRTRQVIWEAARAGMAEKPLLGHGSSRFPAFHQAYVSTHLSELLSRYPLVERTVDHAHNLYFQLLFAWGVAGSLLLLVAASQCVFLLWRQGDLFGLAVSGYFLVTGLAETSIQRTDGILMLFLPLGIAYGRSLLPPHQPAVCISDESVQTGGKPEPSLLPLIKQK